MIDHMTDNMATLAERDRLKRTEAAVFALVYAALFSILLVSVFQEGIWGITVTLGGALVMGAPLVLWKAGRYHAAALGISSVALLIVAASIATGDGFRDPSIAAYPMVLMFAGMTLRSRHFLAFFVVTATTIMVSGFASKLGWIPWRGYYVNDFTVVFITAVVLAATGLGVWFLAKESQVSLHVAHEEIARRKAAEAGLEQLSRTDALTGVYSRRVFDEETARLRTSRRYPVSVLMIDLDDLKLLNDSRGHSAGDQLIINAARVLTSVIRPEDVLARIGGDEFALLLPATDEVAALNVISRIERAISNHNADRPEPHLSMSIGFGTADLGGLDAALSEADHSMYENKARKKSVA